MPEGLEPTGVKDSLAGTNGHRRSQRREDLRVKTCLKMQEGEVGVGEVGVEEVGLGAGEGSDGQLWQMLQQLPVRESQSRLDSSAVTDAVQVYVMCC